jgi:uncharacterized protein (DUF58 family)
MPQTAAGLTRKGRATLAVAAGLFLSALTFGIQELYPVAVAAAVLVGAALVSVRTRRWDLRVTRQVHPARVQAGIEARVELTVRNVAPVRSPVLGAGDPFDGGRRWARFSIAPIAPGEYRTAWYRLPTSSRGVFRLGPLEVELSDAFGMARVVRKVTPDASLTVHPRVDRLSTRSMSARNDRDTKVPLAVLARTGDEFYAMREYQTGDDLRMVHWASTAKLGNLVVRQPESLWRGRATIAIDSRSAVHDGETFEAALSAAASLSFALLRGGSQVRLVTTSGADTGFGSSDSHRGAIFDTLAAASAHPGSGLAERLRSLRRGEPLTLITTDGASSGEVAAACRLGGIYNTTVVVFERRGAKADDGLPAPLPAAAHYLRVPAGVGFRAAWEGFGC